jgi:hypothetical protein
MRGFDYVYGWANTKFGPSLPGRKGQRCRVVVTSRGKRWIEFEDGFRAAVLFWSVRKAPAVGEQLALEPSSVKGVDVSWMETVVPGIEQMALGGPE